MNSFTLNPITLFMADRDRFDNVLKRDHVVDLTGGDDHRRAGRRPDLKWKICALKRKAL